MTYWFKVPKIRAFPYETNEFERNYLFWILKILASSDIFQGDILAEGQYDEEEKRIGAQCCIYTI